MADGEAEATQELEVCRLKDQLSKSLARMHGGDNFASLCCVNLGSRKGLLSVCQLYLPICPSTNTILVQVQRWNGPYS